MRCALTRRTSAAAKWQADLNLIYADEPPPMRALDAIAHNKACDSLGCPGEFSSAFGSGFCNMFILFQIRNLCR
jgi:hypothetical protein